MNTNLESVPVGTRIIETNADGTVTITAVTARHVVDFWFPGPLVMGAAVLLIVGFWLVGRKRSESER